MAEAVGELGPRKAIPVPTARQHLGSAGAVSRQDQQAGPARGVSRKGQQGGSLTRIQLPVPECQSPEVLSLEQITSVQRCVKHLNNVHALCHHHL